MTRRCIKLLLLAGTVWMTVPAAAGAVIPTGNLIRSGDAEAPPTAVTNETDHRCPRNPPWGDCFGNFTAVRYGTLNFPSAAESARIGGGASFFAGGPRYQSAHAYIAQDIDISAFKQEVAAGQVQATLSACLGGFASQADSSDLELRYYVQEESGTDLRVMTAIGRSTPGDRGGRTRLIRYARTVEPVPSAAGDPGTLNIKLVMIRGAGAYNDGYADNLSLTVAPYPGPPAPAVSCDSSAAGPGAGAAPPVGTGLGFSPDEFRAARSGASITAARVGTTVSYSLSEAATTTFTVERAASGRKQGEHGCVRPRRSNRKAERCTRWVRVKGAFTHNGAAGQNSFRFSGRAGGERLEPAKYRLVGVPRDPDGNAGAPLTKRFTIVAK